MKTIIPLTTEGAPRLFALMVPAGAVIRGAIAKQAPGVLANSVKTFFGIFFEGDDDKDYPQEFRVFDWVKIGDQIGTELHYEAVYRAQIFCPDGLFFLYEYLDAPVTQVQMDALKMQRRMEIEAAERMNSSIVITG